MRTFEDFLSNPMTMRKLTTVQMYSIQVQRATVLHSWNVVVESKSKKFGWFMVMVKIRPVRVFTQFDSLVPAASEACSWYKNDYFESF